jgi:hypothetical protein
MKNLKANKGDDITFQATVRRPTDEDPNVYEVVDLTDADAWFTAKTNVTDEDADAVIRKGTPSIGLTGVTITDGPAGILVIDIDELETSDLEDGTVVLHYDLQIREDTGQLTTVQKGLFFLMDQVTISS